MILTLYFILSISTYHIAYHADNQAAYGAAYTRPIVDIGGISHCHQTACRAVLHFSHRTLYIPALFISQTKLCNCIL